MTKKKTPRGPRRFDELGEQIDVDPARRARVEEHKAQMLGALRRKLDLTQAVVADRLDVTQENVSKIERGEADVRLSTLNRYVEALGGRLEVRAMFPGETVALKVGDESTMRRRRTSAASAASATPRTVPATKGSKTGAGSNHTRARAKRA